MRTRIRWMAVAMAGLVLVAAAISFAPRPIPVVPPSVHLDGEVGTTNPSSDGLEVVPAPSVDLERSIAVTTTTSLVPPSTNGQAPAPAPSSGGSDDDDDDGDDSDDSDDDGDIDDDESAGTPDD